MSELPSGWDMGRVGDLIDLGPKNECPDQTEVGFVPLQFLGVTYRARHSFEPRPWSVVKKGYTHFADGDVLLAKITPSFENGKAGIARGLPSGIGAGSTEYFVCRPRKDALLPDYLLAFFKTRRFLQEGEMVMSGAVGQQRVPREYLLNSEIPLASLKEQKRIADKLDALLARVDACRERLDRVPAILKRFRQSVLDSAMSGRLTEEWRQQCQSFGTGADLLTQISHERSKRGLPSAGRAVRDEGIDIPATELPSSWTWCRVGQIADVRLGGTPSRSESSYWNGDIPWVSSGEVSNCRINDTSEKITRTGMENSNAKLYPN